jgi:hypothetical protein
MRSRSTALLGALVLACTPGPAAEPGPPATGAPAGTPSLPVAAVASGEGGVGVAGPGTGSTAPAPTPEPAPPGPATGGAGAAPGEAPARPRGPPEAPPVELLEAVALVPGEVTPLRADVVSTIDPGATFRVALRGALPDARLSLLDPGDAMVAGSGAREAGATTVLTFQPAAPLQPAVQYRLCVDGAATREVPAADGTPRAPVELPLLVAGDPAPSRPAARPKRRRR